MSDAKELQVELKQDVAEAIQKGELLSQAEAVSHQSYLQCNLEA